MAITQSKQAHVLQEQLKKQGQVHTINLRREEIDKTKN